MEKDSSTTSAGIKVLDFVMQKTRILSLCQRHPGINPDRLLLLLNFCCVAKSGHR